MRRFISKFCIVTGFLLIFAALGLCGYNLWDAYRADQASQEITDQLEEEMEGDTSEDSAGTASGAIGGLTEDGEVPLYELYPEMEMPTRTLNGYRYIGILEVPSLNLKLPVMDEWDYTRLKISPCAYAGSIYQHNMVIAGHNYARHFSHLKWAPMGTEIIFTDMDGNEFHYEIAWTEVLNPEDVEKMTDKDVDQWDLTLFTCTTGGGSRYTIRCTLIEEE